MEIYDADARIYAEYANVLRMRGEFERSLRMSEDGLTLIGAGVHRDLLRSNEAIAKYALGDVEGANFSANLAIKERSPNAPMTLAVLGRHEDAHRELAKLSSALPPHYAAWAYIALGDADEVFARLHHAIDDRQQIVIRLIRSEPLLDEMRNDPRWPALIEHLEQAEAEGRARSANLRPG